MPVGAMALQKSTNPQVDACGKFGRMVPENRIGQLLADTVFVQSHHPVLKCSFLRYLEV
jgi:hypothetical protein